MMNRRALVTAGLAALAVPGMALAKAKQAAPKAAAPKFRHKLVTKTFHNPGRILINEDMTFQGPTPYPSPITARGFKDGKVRNVKVFIHGFSHQVPNEVYLMLVAPDGRRTLLLGAAGQGSFVTNLELVFDQKAANSVPQNQPPAWNSGIYKPTNYGGPVTFPAPAPGGPISTANLGAFNGGKANGAWKLYVHDVAHGVHFGEITNGWSVQITARVKIRVKRKKN